MIRLDCLACDNKIESEGDAFCPSCDETCALDDLGNVINLKEMRRLILSEPNDVKLLKKEYHELTGKRFKRRKGE